MKYEDAVVAVVLRGEVPDGFNGHTAVVGLAQDDEGNWWEVAAFGCYRAPGVTPDHPRYAKFEEV